MASRDQRPVATAIVAIVTLLALSCIVGHDDASASVIREDQLRPRPEMDVAPINEDFLEARRQLELAKRAHQRGKLADETTVLLAQPKAQISESPQASAASQKTRRDAEEAAEVSLQKALAAVEKATPEKKQLMLLDKRTKGSPAEAMPLRQTANRPPAAMDMLSRSPLITSATDAPELVDEIIPEEEEALGSEEAHVAPISTKVLDKEYTTTTAMMDDLMKPNTKDYNSLMQDIEDFTLTSDVAPLAKKEKKPTPVAKATPPPKLAHPVSEKTATATEFEMEHSEPVPEVVPASEEKSLLKQVQAETPPPSSAVDSAAPPPESLEEDSESDLKKTGAYMQAKVQEQIRRQQKALETESRTMFRSISQKQKQLDQESKELSAKRLHAAQRQKSRNDKIARLTQLQRQISENLIETQSLVDEHARRPEGSKIRHQERLGSGAVSSSKQSSKDKLEAQLTHMKSEMAAEKANYQSQLKQQEQIQRNLSSQLKAKMQRQFDQEHQQMQRERREMMNDVKEARRKLRLKEKKIDADRLATMQEELLAVKKKRKKMNLKHKPHHRSAASKVIDMEQELARQKLLLKKQEQEQIPKLVEKEPVPESAVEEDSLLRGVKARLASSRRKSNAKQVVSELAENVREGLSEIETISEADPAQIQREHAEALEQIQAEAKAAAKEKARASAKRVQIFKEQELRKLARVKKKQQEKLDMLTEEARGRALIHPLKSIKRTYQRLPEKEEVDDRAEATAAWKQGGEDNAPRLNEVSPVKREYDEDEEDDVISKAYRVANQELSQATAYGYPGGFT